MYFRMLLDPANGAVSYLLADLDAGEAVLVDPRGADTPVLRAMLSEHRLRLKWILRTHEHDAALPAAEVTALQALEAPHVVHRPATGGVVSFGNEVVHTIATPGHTAGCLSFAWRDRLFCGGLLAVDACPFQPRPLDPAALWDSVTREIFSLPGETLLFSAHARGCRAVSQVHEQRHAHPWFAGATRDDFLARVAALPDAAPTPAPLVHQRGRS